MPQQAALLLNQKIPMLYIAAENAGSGQLNCGVVLTQKTPAKVTLQVAGKRQPQAERCKPAPSKIHTTYTAGGKPDTVN